MMYSVVFEDADDGGVGAYIPDIPGIGVVGRDYAEARLFIDQALEMYVEAMIEDGDPLPLPSPDTDPNGPLVRVDPALVEQAKRSAEHSTRA
jgi:predicted RNase H-like HicB family nuclease